jgi:hypothetical protein
MVQVHLPLPSAPLLRIFNRPDFPEAARSVNYHFYFVTTHFTHRSGKGFHEPYSRPCLLKRHGVVYHWLRSSAIVQDVKLSLDQWWTTPDDQTAPSVQKLIGLCQDLLWQINPITNHLLHTCELAQCAGSQAVALRFQYGNTGPDVPAIYHSTGNTLPPRVLLLTWPKDQPRPHSKPIKHGEVDCLAFPLLFPCANSGYDPNLKLLDTSR